jgi:hypothetical protein
MCNSTFFQQSAHKAMTAWSSGRLNARKAWFSQPLAAHLCVSTDRT